jgi:hypothetical protein
VTTSLGADIDRALEALREHAGGGGPQEVVASLQRQLEWCRGYVGGAEMPERPGRFSMGLLATRELDMYGGRPELAALINEIEHKVTALMQAGGDDHALAEAAWEVAELAHDGRLSRPQALKVLRRRFPALTDGQLEEAYGRALFRSR